MSVELLGLAGEQDFRDFENSLETMLRVLRKIDSSISNGK